MYSVFQRKPFGFYEMHIVSRPCPNPCEDDFSGDEAGTDNLNKPLSGRKSKRGANQEKRIL
jgi:hypothetical protein